MRFDEGIDNCIVEQLTKNHIMSFLELFREVKNSYKKISIAAYNFHIKKLVTEDLIGKQDSGERGRKVNYFLTEKAKRLHQFKILEFKSDKQRATLEKESAGERRKKLYLLLFFFASGSIPKKADPLTFERVTQLLKMYGYSINDLVDDEITYFEETKITDYKRLGGIHVIKEQHTVPSLRKELKMIHQIVIHEEAKEESGKITISTFYNWKRDDYINSWQQGIIYKVAIPGISKRDILYDDYMWMILKYINFPPEEIEDAIITLSNEGILTPFMEFNGEHRYKISNKALKDFLNETYRMYEIVFSKMETLWEFIRAPTEQEIKWLEIFHNQKSASNIRTEKYNHRHSLPRKERRNLIEKAKAKIKSCSESLESIIKDIRKKHAYTIKTYNYPFEQLLEMIYPPYLHRVL